MYSQAGRMGSHAPETYLFLVWIFDTRHGWGFRKKWLPRFYPEKSRTAGGNVTGGKGPNKRRK